jgi:hypothetical protein
MDYCAPDESFPALVQARTVAFRNSSNTMGGYWFQYLEDKVGAYLLTVDQKIRAPKFHCCSTTMDELKVCLGDSGLLSPSGDILLPRNKGIVIKATNLHSSQGVFILVNETSPNDPTETRPRELLNNIYMSFTDVVSDLQFKQATKIIVEEFVGDTLPDEYKFHVIDGKVQAIDVILGRGSGCPCYAVVDADWNRLDAYGCFEPAGNSMQVNVDKTNSSCAAIDFSTGRRKAGPVKKDMYICQTVGKPSACIIKDMIAAAEKLGSAIGVYMRVDMFVSGNDVFVQEYSANPMNGLRHCAAKMDGACVDSCFLGRAWKAAGVPYGGKLTTMPTELNGFGDLTPKAQCDLAMNAAKTATVALQTTCSG